MTKDDTEAVKWYRNAAEHGHANAQMMLGGYYYFGRGLPKDYVESYKLTSLAIINGFDGSESLAVLKKLMTPQQIEEGKLLANEFKPRRAPDANISISAKTIVDSNPAASGTGFFISEDGYLISNAHVVEGAAQVRLVTSVGLISAKVMKVDAANDLALLKAEGKFSPLPVSSSRSVKLGATVATVGFPNIGLQGFAPKLAKGEIASLTGAGDDARYFQISVPLQPGNSGGALAAKEMKKVE